MTPQENLARLGIALPAVSAPAAAYLPFVRTGNLVYLSGHIARRNGAGQAAARGIGIDLLGTLHAAAGGLEKVRRIVKLVSFVSSAPGFVEQHLVTNGASELMMEVFGERGAHARSAVGVARLPLDACVEIELIAEVQ